MMKYLQVLFICLQFCGLSAAAQLKEETIRFSEGLPSDFVKQVAFNDQGYLVLATRRGLSQYDGYRFLDHTRASANISSMYVSGRTIYYHDVYEGLCTAGDFYGTPKVIVSNSYQDADPNNDHFDHIFVDSGGRIWCSDFNHVKYFSTRGRKNKRFFIHKNPERPGYFVRFTEPVNGKVWIFTDHGLLVWSAETNKLSRHPDGRLALHYTAAELLSNDEIMLATREGQLMKYRISTSELENLPALPGKEAVQGFEKIKVRGRAGALIYTAQHIYLNSGTSGTELFYQMKDQAINELIVNQGTNVVWVATNKGLVKLFYPDEAVRNMLLPEAARKPGLAVVDLAEVSNGDMYCCTNDRLIWICHQDGRWEKLTIPDPKAQTQSLQPVGDRMLICTDRGVYTIKNKQISKLALDAQTDSQRIKKTILDQNNNLWVLPAGQPVKIYSWPGLQPRSGVFNGIEFWEGNVWNDIFCNRDGKIWLAGWTPKSFGIAVYDQSKNHFKEVSQLQPNNDESLFVGDYYNRISGSRDGGILVSAYGGWNKLDAGGIVRTQLNTKKYEVANDRAEGIAEDNNGKIWFATEEGLHVYNGNTDKVIRISQIDGLPTDDLVNAFRKLSNGNLALGVENGYSIVDVNMIVASQLVNKLELAAIKVNGKVLNSNQNIISLEKGETELELLFSALTFIDKRKIIYRYKFSGEQSWNYLGSKPELSLRHLAPGKYEIRIEAGDNMEHWQSKDLRVFVHVPAPFYQTRWFILLVFVVLLAGIIYVYQYLLYQDKVEEQYKRKLKEAEMQALRSQMNPHFMFNTLNSINSFIIENKTAEASEYLTTFSRLMRDILDNSKHTSIPLHKELQTLKLYLDLEAVRLEHAFYYQISVDKQVQEDTLRVPPLILQPFAENAIWHGLRNKEGKGLLEILISQEDESKLHITIKDNGIGRKAAASYMVTQFKHKSYGVDITSSRLKLLSSESSIVIEDLYDGEGFASGTAVHIYLNLK